MNKKYLAREGDKWIEMDGKQFYAFTKLPENKHRRFIRLGNDICQEADVIYIEASEQEYSKWRSEQNARYYRARISREYETLSLDCLFCGADGSAQYEFIADENADVETEALHSLSVDEMKHALTMLSEDETELLNLIFSDQNSRVSERMLARRLGIPQRTLNNRKAALLKKIKKLMAQN